MSWGLTHKRMASELLINSSLDLAIVAPISSESFSANSGIKSITMTFWPSIAFFSIAPLTRADPILPHPTIPNFIIIL